MGSLPTADGTAATAQAGCLIVLNSSGRVVETLSGDLINGPWDMTAVESDDAAVLFVTNVLNGTVAANGKVMRNGTMVRILLDLEEGAPVERARTVIASGFSERTDPAALVIGPTGVGLGSDGTLYVADTLANRIAAVPNALARTTASHAGAKVKLGSWEEFLAMREGIFRLNDSHRTLLSNDLGAIGGLLFDIGSGRYAAPPLNDSAASREAWERDVASVRELSAKEQKELQAAREGDRTHTEVQGWLRDLGKSLGFDVWIAANDRARPLGTGKLGDGCLAELPPTVCSVDGADSVRLIDVLWLVSGADQVAAAFEVEHTTSIYSGILRLLDLGTGVSHSADLHMFLVAPDSREQDVREQLVRPAFRNRDLGVKFLPYSVLEENRVSMARFGAGIKPVEAIARVLV